MRSLRTAFDMSLKDLVKSHLRHNQRSFFPAAKSRRFLKLCLNTAKLIANDGVDRCTTSGQLRGQGKALIVRPAFTWSKEVIDSIDTTAKHASIGVSGSKYAANLYETVQHLIRAWTQLATFTCQSSPLNQNLSSRHSFFIRFCRFADFYFIGPSTSDDWNLSDLSSSPTKGICERSKFFVSTVRAQTQALIPG